MKRLAAALFMTILLVIVPVVSAQPNKPTPTPLPPGTPVFDIPSSYSLWASTDYAVQSWNLLGPPGVIIQVIILVALIAVGLVLLTRFIKELTQKDSQD